MFLFIFISISQALQVLEEPNQPVPDSVPLSVSIDQMTANYDQSSCNTQIECTSDEKCDPTCGKQCTGTTNEHYFQYEFKGQQFQVYGSKGTGLGPINIQFDDQDIEISINTGETIDHTLLYTSPVLNYQIHTIKVIGKGNRFTIHKFAYWPSIKAKRLNYTELGPSGNWVKQSDGIGGFRAWSNTDSSLTATVECSKIWAYGSLAPNHGHIKIIIDNRFKDVDENSTKRIDGELLFESDYYPFANHNIKVENPYVKEITFYCLYYDVEILPTDTPAPYPSPSYHPLTQDSFIDKVYENSIPYGFLTIEGNMVVNKIKGCTFKNIISGSAQLAKIGKVIEFSDNVFEYSDNVVSTTVFFSSLQDTVFEMKRCTFTKFRTLKGTDQGLIASFNRQLTVNLISCTFNNNGQSEGHFMFKFNGDQSQITFQSCTFYYDNPNIGSKVCKIIGCGLTFDDCTFTNSPRDMINLNPTSISNKVFTFTNNIVQGNTKSFIMASQMRRYNPVIQHNIFRNINLESGYLITYIHYINKIELVNNTFSHITNKAGQYCGGIASWYQNKDNAQMTLKYTDCKFYDNSNLNQGSQYNQGGAIQYGYTTSISNTAVILDGCEFKGNSCPNGQGGAVAFSIDHDLTINNCVFENNKAGGAGGAIYFWSKIVKPSGNTEAPDFVAPIKIEKISITNCQFSGNEGSNGNGIYIDQYYSLSNVNFEILNCNFKNNGENQYSYLIYNRIGHFMFDNNTVEYTDKTKSTGIIYFSIEEQPSILITNSNFVNCYTSQTENIRIDTGNDESETTISGCTFTDCKASEIGFVVYNYRGTLNIDSCTVKFTSNDQNSASGAINLGNKKFSITNSKFEKTHFAGALLFSQKGDSLDECIIDRCIFNDNLGSNYRCFFITMNEVPLIFKNSIIQNQHESGNYGYFFSVMTHTIQDSITLENITFQNNRCNCDYGGGSGVWIRDYHTINFINCHFIGNKELKSPNPRDKRPTEATESDYYSGDGGGLQYGFSDSIYDVDILLKNCEFRDNKAVRHGGALALQTCGIVTIEGCTFTNNLAGYQEESTSPSLLNFKNYFSKKTYGRGGAIYINPAFNHENSNSTFYMKEVSITRCTFDKNNAYDGYAMYIQGDDPGTKFTIQSNTFTDNYNHDESRPGEKSIIFSEIKNIDVGQNTFKDIEGVDHQPITIDFGEPEETEDDGPDYFEVINITTSGRHDYVVKDNSQLIITISISHFSNIHSGPKDGGALYIVNAGLACQDITFDTCTSDKRGGAIFLHNVYNTTNYVNIIRNNISHCSAAVGGGVFIFSSNLNNKVTVRDCTFEYNEATATDSNNLIGGNGLFIAAKKGRVKKNNFVENLGIGSSLHFDNRFTNEQLNTLSVEKKIKFTISDCKFVLSGSSKSAFYYSRGKGGNLVELSHCSFEGKLSKGNHYINGQTLSDNSPKLIVRNCKFAGNQEQAVPLDSDFVSIDLKGQSFESNISRIQKKSYESKSALTVVVSSATITVVAVIAFIVFAIKKKNNNDLADNKMSSEV